MADQKMRHMGRDSRLGEHVKRQELYREAIEATARCFDAPPDVLATLAKDGSFLEWAIISAEAYMKIIPHDARPPNYHEWMQKVEELRTAGETMGEKRNETERER